MHLRTIRLRRSSSSSLLLLLEASNNCFSFKTYVHPGAVSHILLPPSSLTLTDFRAKSHRILAFEGAEEGAAEGAADA